MGCLLLTLSRASALSISTQRGYWKDVLQYASLSVVNEASFGRSTPLPSIIGSTSHDQTRVRVVREGEGVPPHEDGHQLRQVYSSLQSPSQTLKHHICGFVFPSNTFGKKKAFFWVHNGWKHIETGIKRIIGRSIIGTAALHPEEWNGLQKWARRNSDCDTIRFAIYTQQCASNHVKQTNNN